MRVELQKGNTKVGNVQLQGIDVNKELMNGLNIVKIDLDTFMDTPSAVTRRIAGACR